MGAFISPYLLKGILAEWSGWAQCKTGSVWSPGPRLKSYVCYQLARGLGQVTRLSMQPPSPPLSV